MDKIVNIDDTLASLAEQAWTVRENAFIVGDTRVGAAVLTADLRVLYPVHRPRLSRVIVAGHDARHGQ